MNEKTNSLTPLPSYRKYEMSSVLWGVWSYFFPEAAREVEEQTKTDAEYFTEDAGPQFDPLRRSVGARHGGYGSTGANDSVAFKRAERGKELAESLASSSHKPRESDSATVAQREERSVANPNPNSVEAPQNNAPLLHLAVSTTRNVERKHHLRRHHMSKEADATRTDTPNKIGACNPNAERQPELATATPKPAKRLTKVSLCVLLHANSSETPIEQVALSYGVSAECIQCISGGDAPLHACHCDKGDFRIYAVPLPMGSCECDLLDDSPTVSEKELATLAPEEEPQPCHQCKRTGVHIPRLLHDPRTDGGRCCVVNDERIQLLAWDAALSNLTTCAVCIAAALPLIPMLRRAVDKRAAPDGIALVRCRDDLFIAVPSKVK